MPLPLLLGRNGAYLVMRKLEQDVESRFRTFLKKASRRLGHVPAGLDPRDHAEYLAAKMVGRWKDGSPLVLFPKAPRRERQDARIGPTPLNMRAI